jgi:hypothetical protein
MGSSEVLADAYGRIREIVHRSVDGMTPAQLSARVEPQANSIAWLVWHLTRVQDDHISDVAGREQIWISQGWVERFGLPFDPRATGYGHNAADVAALTVPSGELLTGYHDAVVDATEEFVRSIGDADLDRIVDTSWNPPVTLGVRLVSVISDNLQHAGQAAFVKGCVQRS